MFPWFIMLVTLTCRRSSLETFRLHWSRKSTSRQQSNFEKPCLRRGVITAIKSQHHVEKEIFLDIQCRCNDCPAAQVRLLLERRRIRHNPAIVKSECRRWFLGFNLQEKSASGRPIARIMITLRKRQISSRCILHAPMYLSNQLTGRVICNVVRIVELLALFVPIYGYLEKWRIPCCFCNDVILTTS